MKNLALPTKDYLAKQLKIITISRNELIGKSKTTINRYAMIRKNTLFMK